MGISTVAACKKGSTEITTGHYRPNRARQCISIRPSFESVNIAPKDVEIQHVLEANRSGVCARPDTVIK